MKFETAKCYRASCGRRFFTMKGALSREFWIRYKRKYSEPDIPYDEGGGCFDENHARNIRLRFVRFWNYKMKGKGA